MLSSITPLGQRGRGLSWSRTVVAFWIGAVSTGAVVFGVVGSIGEMLPIQVSGWIAVGAVAMAFVLDLAGVRPWGPQRQVDEDWLGKYRDWVTGLGFGAQLGAGFATIVPTWMTWALVVVSFVVGVPGAVLVGAGFGLGRCLLLLTTRKVRSPSALAGMMQRFSGAEGMAGRMAGLSYLLILGVVVLNVV